jgi:hypothetical protein
MTYIRKYDFQPGTRIASSQVDEEFNALIKAVNDIDASDKLKAPIEQAQMYKITPDNGDFKYILGGPANNLFTVEGNLATFYSNKGTQNNPNTETSFRGVYIGAGSDYGEMIALGNDRSIWRNTKLSGVWGTWQKSYDFRDFTQDQLWKGVLYMKDGQSVTPSKKLWDCRNGWVLVWSDFDSDTGKSNDYQWNLSYIPKFLTGIDNGGSVMFPIIDYQNETVVQNTGKILRVNNEILTGDQQNDVSATHANEVVLRYVYEF